MYVGIYEKLTHALLACVILMYHIIIISYHSQNAGFSCENTGCEIIVPVREHHNGVVVEGRQATAGKGLHYLPDNDVFLFLRKSNYARLLKAAPLLSTFSPFLPNAVLIDCLKNFIMAGKLNKCCVIIQPTTHVQNAGFLHQFILLKYTIFEHDKTFIRYYYALCLTDTQRKTTFFQERLLLYKRVSLPPSQLKSMSNLLSYTMSLNNVI